MEVNQKENIPQFSLKSKSQIHFGLDFSNKISDLKIFIYGLRGVSLYEFNNAQKIIVRSRNFKEFNIIRSFPNNFI